MIMEKMMELMRRENSKDLQIETGMTVLLDDT